MLNTTMLVDEIQVSGTTSSTNLDYLSEPTRKNLLSPERRRLNSFVAKGRSILKTNDIISQHRDVDIIKIGHVWNTPKIGHERRKGTTNDATPDRLTINVSGIRFETLRSTLEKYPDTLLGNERRRKYYYDKTHDEYFFDRHRQAFEAILYYYQSNGRLRRPNYIPIDTFLEEITFFDLGKEVLTQMKKDENLEEVQKPPLPRNRYRRYIWATLEYPEFSFIAKCVHIFSILIISASTIGLTIESLPQYVNLASNACKTDYQQKNVTEVVDSNGTNLTTTTGNICFAYFASPFVLLQAICVSFFTLELILRLISMPSFYKFIKNLMNWIDVFAVVPFYMTVGLYLTGQEDDSHRTNLAEFQILRILRFTRVFKFYRIFKNIKAMRVLALTLEESLPDFLILIAILTSLALLFGSAAYFAESIDSTTKFDSIPIAIYWALITITSVGYGDIAPITAAGRVIACLCALSGAGTIAMLVSVLVDRYQRVFTRKLYVKPEHINFDDYSDHDDQIDSKHEDEFLDSKDDNMNVEDVQKDTRPTEIYTDEEEEMKDAYWLPLPDLTDPHTNPIEIIITYANSDHDEESDEFVDKNRSVISEKRSHLDDVKLNLIPDQSLDQLPSSHSPFSFNINGESDINSTHFITAFIPIDNDDRNTKGSRPISFHTQDREAQTTL